MGLRGFIIFVGEQSIDYKMSAWELVGFSEQLLHD